MIYSDIIMRCNSTRQQRCLGAYLEETLPCDPGSNIKAYVAVGSPQWKVNHMKMCQFFQQHLGDCSPGASHGGRGGLDKNYADGMNLKDTRYGANDVKCISGGSAGFSRVRGACYGGGAIEIKAKQGKIIIGGTISTSAVSYRSESYTGCSGGTIRLIAAEVNMEKDASLKVDGLDAGQDLVGIRNYKNKFGNGGGGGGIIQIFASEGFIKNVSLLAGKPYQCNTESYISSGHGLLLIKSNASDENFTLYSNNQSHIKEFSWPHGRDGLNNNASMVNLEILLQQLISLKDTEQITEDKLEKLIENLNHLLNISRGNLTEKQILQYLIIFQNCTEIIAIFCNQVPAVKMQEIFKVILEIATLVVASNNHHNWKELQMLPQFVTTLESMALSISNSKNFSFFQSDTESLVLQINEINLDDAHGYKLPVHHRLPMNSFVTKQDYVYIPKAALPTNPEGYKVVVFLFKDIQDGLPESAVNRLRSKNSSLHVASLLMSCTLSSSNGVPITKLSSPVTLNFMVDQKPDKKKKIEVICGFLNITNNSWDSDGVSVESTNSSQTACLTTHFTNFAVLMQQTEIPLGEAEKLSLMLITYIGCGVSTGFLLIALLVFITMEALSSDRHRIHLNLVIALLVAQILFLSGIKATGHQIVCKIVAGALHYFYMASFMWMLIEGVHLYLKVVKVFGIESVKLKHYLVIGWSLPAMIVGAAVIIKPYGYGTNYVCWLSLEDGFVWAFIGPVIGIITINIFILAAVIKTIVTSASTMKSSEHSHIKAGIKGALVLMPLMGITWLFGLLAVNRDSLIFQYVFTVTNSLQGASIFILHIVFNNEVRMAFKRHREKKQLSRESGDYNASSSGSNERDRRTLGKSSSNNSLTGFRRLTARLSMSMMPRTSRVVQVQPIKDIDEDDFQVSRTYCNNSPSKETVTDPKNPLFQSDDPRPLRKTKETSH